MRLSQLLGLGLGLGLCGALAACQTPLSHDTDGGDASNNNDAAGDVGDQGDGSTPTDGGNNTAPLSYMPTGCSYTVTTAVGTRNNAMGDDSTFGANPTPAAVHVTWASDPSTTAAVLWNTDQDTQATVVQYGTAMEALTQTAHGHVSTGGATGNVVHVHETHLCGLTPDTTYYYQAGGQGHWSAIQSFRTAPAPGGSNYDVNIAIAGDSRDSFDVWHQVEAQILTVSGANTPDFQIFSGDAVALGTVQGAWDQWFTGGTDAMARMPFVMVHGNHDALAVNYMMQFAQPQVGNPTQDELYFSFDYGPIHVVVLNDTPPMADYAGVVQGTELSWLQHDLAAVDRTRTPWVIVSHHKPAYSSSTHSMDSDTLIIRQTWPPVYAQYHVDVVFNGHDHDFEVSKPLDGMGHVVSSNGTVYVTAAGAGAELYSAQTSSYTQYSESVVNFVLLHATEHTLDLNPYRVDGSAITQGHISLTR